MNWKKAQYFPVWKVALDFIQLLAFVNIMKMVKLVAAVKIVDSLIREDYLQKELLFLLLLL